jgi:hypothetical protein
MRETFANQRERREERSGGEEQYCGSFLRSSFF